MLTRIGLFPIVSSQHIAKGMNAKEWLDFCIAAIGQGKGGGKADSANGNIPGGQDVLDSVLIHAEKYAKSKM